MKIPQILMLKLQNDQNFWPYNQYLAIYPINVKIGKSVPSQNWPYNQFGLLSDDLIADLYCTCY